MVLANGQIPLTSMTKVQPGIYLSPVAADSWQRVVNGVSNRYGWIPQLTDGYRTYNEQVRIFTERYTPQKAGGGYYNDVRWWNGTRYVRKPLTAAAAVPGTSNHGWGNAGDVTGISGYPPFGTTRYNQFSHVATLYGWSNAEGRKINEPWHWVLPGASFVDNPGQGSGGSIPVIPPTNPVTPISPIDEEDMPYLISNPTKGYALLDGGRFIPVGDMATVQSWQGAGVKTVQVNNESDWNRIVVGSTVAGLLFYAPGPKWGLWGGGKLTPLGSIDTVNALLARGVPDVTIADADWLALAGNTP